MQPDQLNEELFAGHLNTRFYIQLEDRRVELELAKVMGDKSGMEKIAGVDRFALYFWGPGDFYLPQRSYRMEHEALGDLEIFIVPVGRRDNRYEYEAIFSQMEKQE